jgi:hypothetical protein
MRKDSASIANNTQAIVLAVSFEVAAAKWTWARLLPSQGAAASLQATLDLIEQ